MSIWLAGEEIHYQVSMAGIVSDSVTQAPLNEARVSLVGRPEKTSSCADGHFHFLSLPVGQYTLRASARGYQEISQAVKLEKPGQKILDIQLSLPAQK